MNSVKDIRLRRVSRIATVFAGTKRRAAARIAPPSTRKRGLPCVCELVAPRECPRQKKPLVSLLTQWRYIDKDILCFWSIFSNCIGTSRGFAFVEFNTQEEATRWMEFKQVSQRTRYSTFTLHPHTLTHVHTKYVNQRFTYIISVHHITHKYTQTQTASSAILNVIPEHSQRRARPGPARVCFASRKVKHRRPSKTRSPSNYILCSLFYDNSH